MSWRVEFALPNLTVAQPIEARYIALVPRHDARVIEHRQKYPNLDKFLSSFTDTHGVRVEPSILLSRQPSPVSARTADALAGFRDVLVVASILKGRADRLVYGKRLSRALYSNVFDPYPWAFDKKYEDIFAITPAIGAYHVIKDFRAQCAPDIPVVDVQPRDFDHPLLSRLLEEWVAHFETYDPPQRSEKLFRSLNVASQAMRAPGAKGVTIHDFGRAMMLWASAFEILVHPGNAERVMRSHVCDLLEKVDWVTEFCKQRIYPRSWEATAMQPVACYLYELIYNVRNLFTHGNPVGVDDLKAPNATEHLWMHAAPLYRLALTAYLDMSFKQPAEVSLKAYEPQREQGAAEMAIHTIDRAKARLYSSAIPEKDDDDF